MNDAEWEMLRRRVIADRWTTRAAYLAMACATIGWAIGVLDGKYVQALSLAACAVLAFVVARWEPDLISIEIEDEGL